MNIPILRDVYNMKVPGHYETDDYVFFWAGPFSNWESCYFYWSVGGIGAKFNCSEQAMMAAKANLFGDTESQRAIMRSHDPAEQKAFGRQVRGYVEDEWVKVREEISDSFLLRKFYQNPELKQILLDTGDKIIVEASPYDKVWGIGMGVNNYPDILDQSKWKGQNLLGESLMRVRTRLRDNPVDAELELEAVFHEETIKEVDKMLIDEILKAAKNGP